MELGERIEETGLTAESFSFVRLFSGNDYYFEYPNGDKLESLRLAYFDFKHLPTLESKSRKDY